MGLRDWLSDKARAASEGARAVGRFSKDVGEGAIDAGKLAFEQVRDGAFGTAPGDQGVGSGVLTDPGLNGQGVGTGIDPSFNPNGPSALGGDQAAIPDAPVRQGTTTVEHVRPNERPGVVTLDPVVIEGKAPTAFERAQAAMKDMDPRAVVVDGVVRPPNKSVDLSLQEPHVSHNDKTGLTTIEGKDQMGHPRAISFKEPNGLDAKGNATHHPLQEMADKLRAHHVDFDRAKLAIDGKGNVDYSIGNAVAQDCGHDGPGPAKNMPLTLEAKRDQGQAQAVGGRA